MNSIKRKTFAVLPVLIILSFNCFTDNSNSPVSQSNPKTKPETPEIETIDLFDFEATAPWYIYYQKPLPEKATIITAFEKEYQHFTVENRRTIENTVKFPEESNWAQAGLLLELGCPEGGKCDFWDRTASIQMAINSDDESSSNYVELLRYITPYATGMKQYVDITDYLPLLRGEKKITSFIDTWVGPGHDNGDGWTVTLHFVFYPGLQAGADEIVNIDGRHIINIGDNSKGKTIADQSKPVKIQNPIKASRVIAHLRTTGHSFGNTGNCAEFCHLRQDLYVNGKLFSIDPWRSDCEYNPINLQFGTWYYDRNGWCPGAVSLPGEIDITDAMDLKQGAEVTLEFDIRKPDGSLYENFEDVGLLPHEYVSLILLYYK